MSVQNEIVTFEAKIQDLLTAFAHPGTAAAGALLNNYR